MKILSPMIDFVFKALSGRENQTSKMLLIDLLNEILKSKGEDTIVNLVYLNPFNYIMGIKLVISLNKHLGLK